MGNGLNIAVSAALLGFALPASAETTQTSTTTLACISMECAEFDTAHSALNAFDGNLGTLTGITLQIDAISSTSYYVNFPGFAGPDPSSGSAQLSFASPFDAIVNGSTYSFEIAGSQSISVVGDPNNVLEHEVFTAHGSGTFVLDPALFSYFIGTSDVCSSPTFGIPASGVCVTGQPKTSPTLNNIVGQVDNLTFSQIGAPPYTTNSATYRLTYTYTPFGVPEPASWMMALLGFGAIGWAMRRQITPSFGNSRSACRLRAVS